MGGRIKLYTIAALARKIGMSEEYVRQQAPLVARGELEHFKGYKFFGLPNKGWWAYDRELDIETIE